MVLLKNDGGLLPFGLTTQRLALIGPNAAEGKVQGGGSAQVRPERCADRCRRCATAGTT